MSTNEKIQKFLDTYDFEGLAKAHYDNEIKMGVKEWQEFVEYIRKQEREKTLKEAIDLSDKIESEHETEFNEWRAFKHFRNKLRDSF